MITAVLAERTVGLNGALARRMGTFRAISHRTTSPLGCTLRPCERGLKLVLGIAIGTGKRQLCPGDGIHTCVRAEQGAVSARASQVNGRVSVLPDGLNQNEDDDDHEG